MDISLRQTHSDDLKGLIDLDKACFTDELGESGESYLLNLKSFPKGSMVAVDNEKVIAHLFFHPFTFGQIRKLNTSILDITGSEDVMYLHSFAIAPDYRGKKISPLLLDYFNNTTVKFKFNKQVLVSVQGSKNFWERNGFRTNKIITYHNSEAYYMEKILP